MNQPAKIYQKSPDMVARKVVDEVILVPVRSKVDDVNSIYALNELAARIWELIDGTRRVADIRDQLVAEFEVSQGDAERDLLVLLEQLDEIGGIHEVRAADA
jgi:coenzyme PQQ synthesis protein D (PqqD)